MLTVVIRQERVSRAQFIIANDEGRTKYTVAEDKPDIDSIAHEQFNASKLKSMEEVREPSRVS